MKKRFILLVIMFLVAPLPAQLKSEPRAGTDDYLRAIGFTDEQLGTGVTTEEREAFASVEGVTEVEDPVGDVLNRFGATAEIQVPWADLTRAVLEKDEAQQQWTVSFQLAEDILDRPSGKANVLFYVDGDGDQTNNAPDGIRVKTDREFSIEYTEELGWYADYRWYNAPENFWATNVETAMEFTMRGSDVTFTIPFAELSGDLNPNWRAAVAVSDGTYTQIDVAPGVGFPPPIGETYPTAESKQSSWGKSVTWLLVIGIVMLFLAMTRWKRQ